jgi:hypothetical protein
MFSLKGKSVFLLLLSFLFCFVFILRQPRLAWNYECRLASNSLSILLSLSAYVYAGIIGVFYYARILCLNLIASMI